ALRGGADEAAHRPERVTRLRGFTDARGAVERERQPGDDVARVAGGGGYLLNAVDDVSDARGDLVTRRARQVTQGGGEISGGSLTQEHDAVEAQDGLGGFRQAREAVGAQVLEREAKMDLVQFAAEAVDHLAVPAVSADGGPDPFIRGVYGTRAPLRS